MGPKTLEALIKAGISDAAKLAASTAEELKAAGIGEKTAAKIIANAKTAAEAKA